MYDHLQKMARLEVGLDLGNGRIVRELTLRPVVMNDMPAIVALAGEDPTVLRLELARWCCQIVAVDGKEVPSMMAAKSGEADAEVVEAVSPALTIEQLGRLVEVDYNIVMEAAEAVKKKPKPTSKD